MPPELLLLAQICTKSFVGWASPQTPLGELIALPRPPSWFRGWDPGEEEEGGEGKGGDWDPSIRDGKGGEGNGGKDGVEGREGEGKEGEGRERK